MRPQLVGGDLAHFADDLILVPGRGPDAALAWTVSIPKPRGGRSRPLSRQAHGVSEAVPATVPFAASRAPRTTAAAERAWIECVERGRGA